MKIYITVDGGTTNTRVSLVKDGKPVCTEKLPYGAKAGIGNAELLKKGVKDAVFKLLEKDGISQSEVECILASGMITSEFGLYNLPHINAPAGIKELHAAIARVNLPEISQIPFAFLCGVKTSGEGLHGTDMMRGEETELYGLLSEVRANGAYLLPGSHSKLIFTDSEGRIASFITLLTGEMAASLSQDTILKDAVSLNCDSFDGEYLSAGYEYCEKYGINEALFKVRILKNIFSAQQEQIYSFFMGVVLQGEIRQIIKSGVKSIVIGGKRQLREATALLLKEYSAAQVVTASDDEVQNSVINGMIKIYEYRD